MNRIDDTARDRQHASRSLRWIQDWLSYDRLSVARDLRKPSGRTHHLLGDILACNDRSVGVADEETPNVLAGHLIAKLLYEGLGGKRCDRSSLTQVDERRLRRADPAPQHRLQLDEERV